MIKILSEIKNVLKKDALRNLIILGVLVILLFIFKPWVQVGEGERGIAQNFGAVQYKVLSEGIHFKIHIVQTVILMDVKIQKALTDAASSSSDLIELRKIEANLKANVTYELSY